MTNITSILQQAQRGDRAAADQLLPLVYDELRKLAAARLAQERPGQTLQPTDLVHDAYLRLVGPHLAQKFNGRGHFFAAAAEAMRRILVERARHKHRVCHGGELEQVELREIVAPLAPDAETILAVDEAVARLADEEPEVAEVVKLHFFAGLTLEETAEARGISRATVYRQWSYARACLRLWLREE